MKIIILDHNLFKKLAPLIKLLEPGSCICEQLPLNTQLKDFDAIVRKPDDCKHNTP